MSRREKGRWVSLYVVLLGLVFLLSKLSALVFPSETFSVEQILGVFGAGLVTGIPLGRLFERYLK